MVVEKSLVKLTSDIFSVPSEGRSQTGCVDASQPKDGEADLSNTKKHLDYIRFAFYVRKLFKSFLLILVLSLTIAADLFVVLKLIHPFFFT